MLVYQSVCFIFIDPRRDDPIDYTFSLFFFNPPTAPTTPTFPATSTISRYSEVGYLRKLPPPTPPKIAFPKHKTAELLMRKKASQSVVTLVVGNLFRANITHMENKKFWSFESNTFPHIFQQKITTKWGLYNFLPPTNQEIPVVFRVFLHGDSRSVFWPRASMLRTPVDS